MRRAPHEPPTAAACAFAFTLCAGACSASDSHPAGAHGGDASMSGTGGTGSGSGGAHATAGTATGGTGASGAGGSGGATSTGGRSASPMTGAGGGNAQDAGAPQQDAAATDASGQTGDSDILAPAHGALLGIFYGADDVAATTAKLGRSAPIHLTYYAWGDDWPTASNMQADLAAGRIPLVNWEPYDATLDDIISGSYDTRLHEIAGRARDLQAKFFFDFAAEMNGNWSPWSGADNGMSADKYIAAYRHLHDVFTGDGATNIVFAWCPNVTSEPSSSWNDTLNYYPGDAYVDWTCVDGYNWGTTNGGGWQSFHDVFENVYAKLATKGKPILIGEMASTEQGGDKAAWIDQLVPTLQSDFPLIKALVWFDIDKETDWRISSSPASEAAFVRLANDPYMNP